MKTLGEKENSENKAQPEESIYHEIILINYWNGGISKKLQVFEY